MINEKSCLIKRFAWPGFILLGLLLTSRTVQLQEASKSDDGAATATESISSEELSRHLKTLTSDFKGRASAKEGEKMTAEYIASEFKKYGLLPAGTDGYLQSFKANNNFAKGTGYNVMGYLEGSDPELKKEFISIGAHIDAVGGVGADDDGSGTVAMLELAQAFSVMKQKPKRSLMFYGFGSEEAWMVGSYYYKKNPARFPITDTKVYLNLDMIGRNDRSEKQVYISGSESGDPSMESIVTGHGTSAGLKVRLEDKMISPPGDAMPFYESGVPFLYFYSYGYGEVHADYHKPTDTHQKIDFASEEKITKLAFKIAVDLANLDKTPSHVKGYKFPHPAQGKPKKRK